MSHSDKQLRSFAQWLNQPLTPGSERELNRWLAEDPDNQDLWQAWQRVNARAKRLQVVSGDVNSDWTQLKTDLGFIHSEKHRKRSRSSSREPEFYRRPAVVAVSSMIVYSLFLYVLHLLRVYVGF